MGNDGTKKKSDWLRRPFMTLVQPAGLAGGLVERASNHTIFVVEQIGRAIVAGEYPAETMIPLDPDLCEMFNVSRTVVREAKKTLIAKGMIQSKAKVGTHVRPSDEWNMFDEDVLRWHASMRSPGAFYDELFEIRLIFEPAAAAQAATRANTADCAALFALCDMLATSESRADFAVADYDFHKQVLKLSGNRFLNSLGDIVQTALHSLFMLEAHERFPEGKEEVAQNHHAIARAIASGAAEEARAAMATVIRNGYRRVGDSPVLRPGL